MRITLVNPNTNVATTQAMCAIADRHLPSGTSAEGVTARIGSPLITTGEELHTAARAVAALAPDLRHSDGIIVSAFGDPGVGQLRAALAVPVVGIGEAAMAEAASHDRFAIVTTTPALTLQIEALAARHGLAEQLVSIVTTPGDPQALMADPDVLANALLVAVDAAAAKGAQAVVIGGGPLGEAAAALSKRTSVKLIAPIPSAVRLLLKRMAGVAKCDARSQVR